MAHIDVFTPDAFNMLEMSAAISKRPYLPSFLGDLGMFTVKRLRTQVATFEQKAGTLNLIQTSARGAPLTPRTRDARTLRYLAAPRIAKADTINASELANLRAFGTESELSVVQTEVNERMENLRRDIALTWENMRLGAVQGIVTDADASTLYNLFTLFDVSQPSEVDFDLDNASPADGVLRTACTGILRSMQRAAADAWIEGTTYAYGLCGDTFFDQFIAHKEYRAWQLNHPPAVNLAAPTAFREIDFAGIRFRNYRGTDDTSTVAIGATKCKFFPVAGGPDLWQAIFTPGEFLDTINLPGQELYALTIPDRDRNAHVAIEMYSYPLFVCTRPLTLLRAKNT